MAIFPQAQKAVGGIFDRINQASSTPAFGLGIGFLSGSPQAGFSNAMAAKQMQAQQAAEMQAAEQSKAQAQQQQFRNDLELAKLALERRKAEQGPADPSVIREAKFVHPDSVAKQREYIQKKALNTNTSVTIQGEQQSEFAKGLGKIQAEELGKMQALANEANNQIFAVSQLEMLLDQGVPTGTIASATLPVRQFASDLGIDVDNERIAQQESFRTITNQMALRLRNPESGMGLTGNTSNRDLTFLKESVPGLEKTEVGNRLIIYLYKKAQARKIQAARLAEQFASQNGSMTGFSSALNEWAQENPLYTDEDRAKVRAILDGGAPDTSKAGSAGTGDEDALLKRYGVQ